MYTHNHIQRRNMVEVQSITLKRKPGNKYKEDFPQRLLHLHRLQVHLPEAALPQGKTASGLDCLRARLPQGKTASGLSFIKNRFQTI